MTQLEKLYARLKQLCNENPSRALHVTIVIDEKKEPLLWLVDEPQKVEGKQGDKPTDLVIS